MHFLHSRRRVRANTHRVMGRLRERIRIRSGKCKYAQATPSCGCRAAKKVLALAGSADRDERVARTAVRSDLPFVDVVEVEVVGDCGEARRVAVQRDGAARL